MLKLLTYILLYLPNFKGTSVTRWQKFYNPKFIGATLHYLNQDYDSGKIILQKKINNQFNLTHKSFLKD